MKVPYKFIHPTKTGGTTLKHTIQLYYHHLIDCNTFHSTMEELGDFEATPIIVIRNPIDRFCSIYNYWLAGNIDDIYFRTPQNYYDLKQETGIDVLRFLNDPAYTNHVKNVHPGGYAFLINKLHVASIDHGDYRPLHFTPELEYLKGVDNFLDGIEAKDKNLYGDNEKLYFRREHVTPQTDWLQKDDWSRSVVIRYSKDLSDRFDKLLNYIGCPKHHEKLFTTNKTKVTPNDGIYLKDLKTSQIERINKLFSTDTELWEKLNTSPQLFKKVI